MPKQVVYASEVAIAIEAYFQAIDRKIWDFVRGDWLMMLKTTQQFRRNNYDSN